MCQAKKNAKEDKSATKTPSKTAEKNVGKDGKEENGSMGNSNKIRFVHKDILDATKRRVSPTDDMKIWSIDMIAYYKQKSDSLVDKGVNIKVESNEEFEDVLEEISGIARCMEGNVVKAMEEGILGDC
ncbi:hypothetical protein Tco_0405266 [Tanacetum coccineum]